VVVQPQPYLHEDKLLQLIIKVRLSVQYHGARLHVYVLLCECPGLVDGRLVVVHLLKDRGLLILLVVFLLNQLSLVLVDAHALVDELGAIEPADGVENGALHIFGTEVLLILLLILLLLFLFRHIGVHALVAEDVAHLLIVDELQLEHGDNRGDFQFDDLDGCGITKYAHQEH